MAKTQYQYQSNDGAVPLSLEVQYEFVPASGLSPTVEVYRASDHYYADWTTMTFKAPAASGDKYGSMSEVPSNHGLYQRNFNPVDFGQILPQQHFYARYQVTIPSGYVAGENTLTANLDLYQTDMLSFTDMVGSGVTEQFGMDASFIG